MKGMKLYLFGTAIVLVLYLLAQYYKPKETDWTQTYLKDHKIPFGLYILYHEIGAMFPDASVSSPRLRPYNTLHQKKFSDATYLFINGSSEFDELDFKELKLFMERGNAVFIATHDLGKLLSDTLNLNIATRQRSVAINFVNPELKKEGGYLFKKETGDYYFAEIDTARATVLGKDELGYPNFVKYSFGKGALYILPNPQLFTNYQLLQPEGAAYASKALSYLPPSAVVMWDENNTRGTETDSSILRVILKHPPLRWAYYLSLTGLLLFIVFEIKRRQRIIPVLLPLKNSSVDFVRVVGKVYYEQRDNRDIAQKKINYLLDYIRSNYSIKTDENLLTTLIERSVADGDTLRDLFMAIDKTRNNQTVSDTDLIHLNKLIEKFYNQAT